MDIWNAAMAQISSIIRRGHAARLSDKAFLEREITAWLHLSLIHISEPTRR